MMTNAHRVERERERVKAGTRTAAHEAGADGVRPPARRPATVRNITILIEHKEGYMVRREMKNYTKAKDKNRENERELTKKTELEKNETCA